MSKRYKFIECHGMKNKNKAQRNLENKKTREMYWLRTKRKGRSRKVVNVNVGLPWDSDRNKVVKYVASLLEKAEEEDGGPCK